MLNIREAQEADIKILCSLGAKTFRETYEEANSKEDMDKYLIDAFNEGQINKELLDKNSKFLIANLNSEDVGYLKIGTNRTIQQLKGEKAIELERMYVLKSCIGNGVGKEMLKYALNYLKKAGYKILWVQVWGDMYDKNLKAIEFYKKWGFKPFGKEIFNLGGSKQKDILMKLFI